MASRLLLNKRLTLVHKLLTTLWGDQRNGVVKILLENQMVKFQLHFRYSCLCYFMRTLLCSDSLINSTPFPPF